MPNGVDQNYARLAFACAAFRTEFGTWPTEARLAPVVLWDYGQLFDQRNFETLCSRLRLRTTHHAHIAVGNARHHVVYETLPSHDHLEFIDEAFVWLEARVRPEFAHFSNRPAFNDTFKDTDIESG